jgi:hypothetical protein
VLTQPGVLASTGRNASVRAARQLGEHCSGQRPTKQHTTQEARCNPPIGTGVCGNVPCWLALALRHPPQAAQKKTKKLAKRENRTRNLIKPRQTPSPLGCSHTSQPLCFNVYKGNRHLMRSLALSCALPESHMQTQHMRPCVLGGSTRPAPHPRPFPPCTAAPRRRRTAAYAAFLNPHLDTSIVFAAAAGEKFWGSGQQRAHRPPRWVVFWDTGQGNSEGGIKGGHRGRAFSRACFPRTAPPS